ncbi:hypothetical protein ACWD0J_34815, partial [Streptomyces sp. NPDC003011]
PTITNDGVSIAKEIELEDPYEKIGAEPCAVPRCRRPSGEWRPAKAKASGAASPWTSRAHF